MDPLNDNKKIPVPWNKDDRCISDPWNCVNVLSRLLLDGDFKMNSIYLLVHNDAHGIVQQTFAKNDGIEFGVYFILVEYGQYCHRIGSG